MNPNNSRFQPKQWSKPQGKATKPRDLFRQCC